MQPKYIRAYRTEGEQAESGPALAASLDALKTELRELIRANPPDSEGSSGTA